MLRYTFRRVLIMIPTLVVISFVTFVIIQLPPGDYVVVATRADNDVKVEGKATVTTGERAELTIE
jgi:peptide/nickel transport system permease protein